MTNRRYILCCLTVVLKTSTLFQRLIQRIFARCSCWWVGLARVEASRVFELSQQEDARGPCCQSALTALPSSTTRPTLVCFCYTVGGILYFNMYFMVNSTRDSIAVTNQIVCFYGYFTAVPVLVMFQSFVNSGITFLIGNHQHQ